MNNFNEQSFETNLSAPNSANASNPKISVLNTNIIEDDYGHIKDAYGEKVKVTKYTLLNEQKAFIEIINYGATVISCWVPNALGELEDVLLGFDSIEDYRLRNVHSIGSTLGRVTDHTISNGNFINDHGNHYFNGDEKGFDTVIWDGYVSGDELVLTHSSRDGEEGYPGTLQARIIFRFTCKNELVIDYTGMTSKSTPVNITSNMFFNLAGHSTGESQILNHSIMVNANEYVPVKLPKRMPVGLLKNVHHTCLDLRVPRLLKKAFKLVPGYGYNHTFKLFKGTERKAFNLATSLVHLPSGRMLDVYTDMPCIFVNTAQNFPIYGKTFLNEEVVKVTDITVPIAKFGNNENDQTSSASDEYRSTSDLEMLPEDELNEDNAMENASFRSQPNIYDVPVIGKSKTVYSQHSGICVRPQLLPVAMSHDENFKNSIILKPTNLYSQRVIYKFGVIPIDMKNDDILE